MNGFTVKKSGSLALLAALLEPGSMPIGSVAGIGQVGTLRTARAAHTATTLPPGQVLIVGGMRASDGSLATVELFDPTSNRIEELGSLAEGRATHIATLLKDGSVLLAGGYDGEYLKSVEIFDLSTRRFRRGGALMEGRSGHTATLLRNGRVLLVGGIGRGWTFLRSAELHDPETGHSQSAGAMSGSFAQGPSMANQRYKIAGTTVVLSNGDVLVTSGARSAELLRSGSSDFVEVRGRFPDAYHFAAAASLHGGHVFIAGGYSDANRNTAGIWRFSRP